jgi:hypothetical protein
MAMAKPPKAIFDYREIIDIGNRIQLHDYSSSITAKGLKLFDLGYVDTTIPNNMSSAAMMESHKSQLVKDFLTPPKYGDVLWYNKTL